MTQRLFFPLKQRGHWIGKNRRYQALIPAYSDPTSIVTFSRFIFSAFAVELLIAFIAEIKQVSDEDSETPSIWVQTNVAADGQTPTDSVKFKKEHLTVLIVDSSALNRKMLIRVISRNNILPGATFAECSDGLAALRMMEGVGRPFDWVFMGHTMSQMCGPDAAVEMRSKLRYNGFIVGLIGDTSDWHEAAENFKKCGANEVIFKPVERGKLINIVEFCKEMAAIEIQRKNNPVIAGKSPVAVRAAWRFFTGPDGIWNTFDVLVVVFCIPAMPSGKGNASILRLITRLCQPAKILRIRSMPAFQVLLEGLLESMNSIGYILAIMLLVVYLYAVVGVIVFSKSDPFYFGSIQVAVMTLFHTISYDEWVKNFYINFYGCDMYHGGIYIESGNETLPMYRCNEPKGTWFAAVYWVSFIVFSALLLLSMFVGTLTMRMEEALTGVHMEAVEVRGKQRFHITHVISSLESLLHTRFFLQMFLQMCRHLRCSTRSILLFHNLHYSFKYDVNFIGSVSQCSLSISLLVVLGFRFLSISLPHT